MSKTENSLYVLYVVIVLLCLASVTGAGDVCEANAGGGQTLIFVTSVVTTESEILTDEEIRAITGKLEGRSVEIGELQEAVGEINALYTQKGFFTARAILPPQTVKNGVVEIQLIEGRVGDILVEGGEYTRDLYFLQRISLKPGDLVRLDKLEEDITRFNLVNNSQITAELRAGSEFGTTDVVLQVTEPRIHQWVVFLDNGGRNETGLYRAGVNYARNSVFGVQDTLSAGATYAPGSQGVSVSYSLPVGAKGAKVSLSCNASQTEIIVGELQPIDVVGVATDLGLRATYPFVVNPGKTVSGFVGWRAKQSDHYFSGVNLVRTMLQIASLGVSAQFRGEKHVWDADGDVSSVNVQAPDTWSFITLSGSVMWQRSVWRQGILTCKGAFQVANAELLPSSEQYAIGGASSIRGYPPGARMGDKGYSLSVELSYPIFKWLRGTALVDHGGVFPYKGNQEPTGESDFITSVGISAAMQFTQRIAGNVAVAAPVGADSGSVQFHFTLQAGF